MKTTDFFLAQIEREAEATRRVLERVPEGLDDWKPHEKSMPLGKLTMHVETLPRFGTTALAELVSTTAPSRPCSLKIFPASSASR